MELDKILGSLTPGLRAPLIEEYQSIVQNFMERRWRPTELSGARFCEIVYTILDGYAKEDFVDAPVKPDDIVGACRTLEKNTHVPRSFRILIPRMLPALYEIRNSRNVGHVGGDVDPNHMDSVAVLSSVNWIMAELVRVLHKLPSMEKAQSVVDALSERRIPIVWQEGNFKRVLHPKMNLPEQILVLLSSSAQAVTADDLLSWTGCSTRSYLNRLLRKLHSDRQVEFNEKSGQVSILPPGSERAESVIAKYI